MIVTEEKIRMLAPNDSAVTNGKKLSNKGSFSNLQKNEEGTVYWAECKGSGKNPYHTSIDFMIEESPVCRCSCPSRQNPCKHAIGLLFELMEGKEFQVGEMPEDLQQKREKQAKRIARKEEEKTNPPKEKKSHKSAQIKKIKKQLEGLDLVEKMIHELLVSGIATLAGSSVKPYEKFANDLGSYYLIGPQQSFLKIAVLIKKIQVKPNQAQIYYEEVIRVLTVLHATVKKARVFLNEKLDSEKFEEEETVLFEALGGVWKLDQLDKIGAFQEKRSLIQLAFHVGNDEVRKEIVYRGYWVDMENGEISQTIHYRPLKALSYVKEEDSCLEKVNVEKLYYYPGGLNKRIRMEQTQTEEIQKEDYKKIRELAQPNIQTAVKAVKNEIKNTLSPKYVAMLLPFKQIGRIAEQYVLEDVDGERIVLRDYGKEDGTTSQLEKLPDGRLFHEHVLFGLVFFDEEDKRICIQPYSIVTEERIVRLKY